MNIRERGIDAAGAYLERVGAELVDEEVADRPEGVDLLAIDGDTLVAAVVQVRRNSGPDDGYIPDATLDTILVSLADRRDTQLPMLAALQVDLIAILVLSEDRALLRHHRGLRTA